MFFIDFDLFHLLYFGFHLQIFSLNFRRSFSEILNFINDHLLSYNESVELRRDDTDSLVLMVSKSIEILHDLDHLDPVLGGEVGPGEVDHQDVEAHVQALGGEVGVVLAAPDTCRCPLYTQRHKLHHLVRMLHQILLN